VSPFRVILGRHPQESGRACVLVDVFAARRRPTRVLLVDDDPAFRELLAFVVRVDSNADVVGQATDGEEGVRLAAALEPEVVLMDLQMPKLDGFEATRRIAATVPDARILVVSSSTEPDAVRCALEAGAAGFLSKDRAVAELPEHLERLRTAKRQAPRPWQPLSRRSQMASAS
jgi:DNA-binding NarL/FixJ family response regulator